MICQHGSHHYRCVYHCQGRQGPQGPQGRQDREDGEEGAAKKGLPIKLIAIIGAAAVIVLGGGGAAAFFLLKPSGDAAHAEQEKGKSKKKEGGHGKEKKGEGKPDPNAPVVREGPDGIVFYTLPDIVVNMQTADGKPTFLKLKLTFELPDADTADLLEPNAPRLQDMFQTFLRELRPEDLSGSQGSYLLRSEILR